MFACYTANICGNMYAASAHTLATVQILPVHSLRVLPSMQELHVVNQINWVFQRLKMNPHRLQPLMESQYFITIPYLNLRLSYLPLSLYCHQLPCHLIDTHTVTLNLNFETSRDSFQDNGF